MQIFLQNWVKIKSICIHVTGGILLPDASGISDPCEKDPQDAFANLNSQQREDITAVAQNTLRLIAFRQVKGILCNNYRFES